VQLPLDKPEIVGALAGLDPDLVSRWAMEGGATSNLKLGRAQQRK